MRINNLDLNLLAVLDALLTYQNVTRAAEQLNLTQPTISNALSRLRYHFRDELLVLVGRRMVPTPFATTLRAPIAELLQMTRRVSSARSAFIPEETEQTIEIIASDYVAEVLIFDILRHLAEVAPGITIRITSISPDSQRAFSDSKADLLIMPEEGLPAEKCQVPLFEDRFVPVVWSGNHAIGETLSLDAFKSLFHAAIEFDLTNSHSIPERFFDEAGFKRKTRLRLPSYSAAASAIIGTPYLTTLPHALAVRRIGDQGLRILRPDFAYPQLLELMKWPAHLDADPCSRWLRALIAERARLLMQTEAQAAPLRQKGGHGPKAVRSAAA